jgi:hypothetical protein
LRNFEFFRFRPFSRHRNLSAMKSVSGFGSYRRRRCAA